MSKKTEPQGVLSESDPFTIQAPVSFQYYLDKKKTYAPISSQTQILNSTPLTGVYLPGHSQFHVRDILRMYKSGDEFVVDVTIPDVEETRTISVNLIRQLCPEKFIDFLLEHTDL